MMSCQCCCYRCRERIYFNHRVGCPCTGLIPQLSLRSRCPRNLNLLKTYQPRTINSWWGDLRDTFRSRTGRLTCMLFRRYLCILDLHWGLRILGSLWPHRSSLNRRPPYSSGSKHRLYRSRGRAADTPSSWNRCTEPTPLLRPKLSQIKQLLLASFIIIIN